MKKNPLSLQVDMEDFLPATDAEKDAPLYHLLQGRHETAAAQ